MTRFEKTTKKLLSKDGQPLRHGDICQFTDPQGKVHKGLIDDAGNAFTVKWTFLCSEGTPRCESRYSIETSTDIKIITPSKYGYAEEISIVVKVEDLVEKALIDMGFSVERHEQGLLVNQRYMVAGRQRKWRAVGKNRWYWFKDAESLRKYFTSNYRKSSTPGL